MPLPADMERLWRAASATSQIPAATCYINTHVTPVRNVVSVDFDTGVEQQSSTVTIRISADSYPTYLAKQWCEVHYGYIGELGGFKACFLGEVEDIDTRYLPYFIEIKAAGYLKRLQRRAGSSDEITDSNQAVRTWNNATDSEIWNDIMEMGPITGHDSGTGDGRTIVGPVEMLQTDSLRAFIDDLDASSESGQRTFEFFGRAYRRPMLRVPSGTPTHRYADVGIGYPIQQLQSVARSKSDREVCNQVKISGTPAAGDDSADYVFAVRQEYSPYWGFDGDGNIIYNPFTLENSKFLETREQCEAVADRYMIERNKITDRITMRTPLNPFAFPTNTVGLLSTRMGLPTETNYWVRHLHHHWGTDGAYTDWDLEGGAGDEGYLVGLPPVAQVTVKVSKETWLVAGVPTTYYTISADGSSSFDPDGTIAGFAWSNNKNADTSSDSKYTTKFTAAQWDTAEIELIVTDDDTPTPHTDDTGMVSVQSYLTDEIPAGIAMFVAAYGVAEATPDGWETANQWVPLTGNVLSVCRIGAEGTNYFGLDNGHIYRTTDYLATTPTDVGWTAPGGSAVNALWMEETNSNIIGIGLANGDFYVTRDAFATAPTRIYSFINPITWIEGSYESTHQWRIGVGQDVWWTNNDFVGDTHAIVTFSGMTVEQTELTHFANYASASGAAGSQVLKRESDGFPFNFPALSPAPSKVRMTAFILTDDLLIGDDQGRSFISSPASAGTTPVRMTDIGYGAVNDMLRDNTNDASAYAGCMTALAKTYDRAVTWLQVRAYDGSATKALQLGYDSAPLTPPVESGTAYLVERGALLFVTNSSIFHENGTTVAMNLYNDSIKPGIHTDSPPPNWYQLNFDDTAVYIGAGGVQHHWLPPSSSIIGGSYSFTDTTFALWAINESGTYNGTPTALNGGAMVVRHKFRLPSMALATVTWQALAVSGGAAVSALYINGTSVSVPTGSGHYLDPSLFVADGITDNIVAIEWTSTTTWAKAMWNMVFSDANNTFYLTRPDSVPQVVSTCEQQVWSQNSTGPSNWNAAPQMGESDGHTNNTPISPYAYIYGITFYTRGLFRKNDPTSGSLYHIAEAQGATPAEYTAADTHQYYRRVFTAPGSLTDVTLTMKVDGAVEEIWINGNQISVGTTYPRNVGTGSVAVYHLSPTEVGYLTASALNAIAFKVSSRDTAHSSTLAWVLDFDNFTGTTY